MSKKETPNKFSRQYSNRFIGGVVLLFLFFAISFLIFQGQREKEYRIDLLDARLASLNDRFYAVYNDSSKFSSEILFFKDTCRITVLNAKGDVIYDTKMNDVGDFDNHLNRPEIIDARKNGHGRDLQRTSASTGEQYFYSATFYPTKQIYIRSAIPYNIELTELMHTDRHYIYFAMVVFGILIVILIIFNRRLGIYRQIREMESQVLREREQFIEMKHQLTENIAHELRTPVAAISGYMQTLMTNKNIDHDMALHFITRSYEQTQRLTNMLRDVSTLSKLDSLKEQEFTPVNIRTVIDEAIADMQEQISAHSMSIVVELPDEIPTKGNPTLLYSVFRNLIENSVAYAGDGTQMSIKLTSKDTVYYHFMFSDNGCGVPEEHLPRLFDRFYRIDKGRSRKLGGTGLGLSIVKNSIVAHGGYIRAKQNTPQGLTFIFNIRRTK